MALFEQEEKTKTKRKILKPKKKTDIVEEKFIPPKLCYWKPRELTNGLSDYFIDELDVLLEDLSWYKKKKYEFWIRKKISSMGIYFR